MGESHKKDCRWNSERDRGSEWTKQGGCRQIERRDQGEDKQGNETNRGAQGMDTQEGRQWGEEETGDLWKEEKTRQRVRRREDRKEMGRGEEQNGRELEKGSERNDLKGPLIHWLHYNKRVYAMKSPWNSAAPMISIVIYRIFIII